MSYEKNEQKQKQQVLNVVQRTERLEKVHDALASETMAAFSRVDKKFVEHSELLGAIVDIVGADTIVARINERQQQRDKDASDKAAAGVKLLVEKGDLKVVDTIGEKTLIVGRDLDAGGNPIGPGRVQVEFALLKPDFKEKLAGGKVGTTIVTASDEEKGVTQTFEVTELYEFAEKAEAKPSEPESTPAAE